MMSPGMSHTLALVLLLWAGESEAVHVSPRQPSYGDCSLDDFTMFASEQLNVTCLSALNSILSNVTVNENLEALDEDHVVLYKTLCDPACGQNVVDFFLECNAEFSAQFGIALCAKRSDGRLCYDVAVEGLGLTDALASECFPYRTGQCNDSCRQAVMAVKEDLGCCVNSFYNGTFSQTVQSAEITDYRVWGSCGVELPDGECKSTLSASAIVAATVSAWLTCALAAAVAALMITFT